MATSKALSANLALIFCNIIWACDYPFYSLILGKYISPIAMVTASLVVAAIFSLIPLLWERAERLEPNDRLKIIGAAILMGLARKLCMMYGLASTSSIDGSIISTTTPLLVLILSVAAGMEHLTRTKSVGLLLGMVGTIAIIIASNSGVHEKSSALGNILIIISACVSAAYMVWFRRLVGKYRITTVLRWIYCTSAIVMLPFGAHDIATTELSSMSGLILFATLFVLIVPTYLPNLLLNYSLRVVTPSVTSIYAYIQPVIAIALSVAMGLDKLHPDTIIFAIITFIGVGMVAASNRTATPKTK
ncbi:MAG: DMT family transporter [Alistipes sp.]|nr:DMT family transporter [Alistipes sp.]